jgi:hypothetical protein
LAVGKTEQKLHRAVTRLCPAHHGKAANGKLLLQLFAQRTRKIGHFDELPGAFLKQPLPNLLGPISRMLSLGEKCRELAEAQILDIALHFEITDRIVKAVGS